MRLNISGVTWSKLLFNCSKNLLVGSLIAIGRTVLLISLEALLAAIFGTEVTCYGQVRLASRCFLSPSFVSNSQVMICLTGIT
jgi:hypothetical protein